MAGGKSRGWAQALGGLFGGGWSAEALNAIPAALAWVDGEGAPLRLNEAAAALWAEGLPTFVGPSGVALEAPWVQARRTGAAVAPFAARVSGRAESIMLCAAAPCGAGVAVALFHDPGDDRVHCEGLLEALPGLAILTTPGGVVQALHGDVSLLTVPPGLAAGRSLSTLLPRGVGEAWSAARAAAVAGETGTLGWSVTHLDGRQRLRAQARATALPYGAGAGIAWLISVNGDGDPLAAQAAEQSIDAVVSLDGAGHIRYANQAFARLVERSAEAIIGEPFARFEASPGPIIDSLDRLSGPDAPWAETRIGPPDAPETPCGVRVRALPGEGPVRHILALRDLRAQDETRAFEQRLKHTDPSTGLPNRDRLMHLLSHRSATSGWAAVALIGFDDLRLLGPGISETQESSLVQVAARRLRQVLPMSVEVVRAAPDVLGLLLDDLGGPRATTTGAAAKAGLQVQLALEALSEPVELHGYQMRLKVRAGITLCLGRGSRTTYSQAEFALRRDRQGDQLETVRFYDPQLWGVVETELQLRAAAERALTDAKLVLHFQPVVNAQGQAVSAEGLLRWPERSLQTPAIGPMAIIEALEACGKLAPFTDWCIDSALVALTHLDGLGLHLPTMAVNVDAKALLADDFVVRVAGLLGHRRVDAHRLTLELTEHAVVGEMSRARARMDELEALGVRLVQDDFGTGHASLLTLHQLPFKALKIDRSFVDVMITDQRAARIVEASTYLAQPLKLGVIAEGVETAEQLARLLAIGCTEFQGWHFSRELPLDRLATWLQSHGIAQSEGHGAPSPLLN